MAENNNNNNNKTSPQYITNQAVVSALSVIVMLFLGWVFTNVIGSIDYLKSRQESSIRGTTENTERIEHIRNGLIGLNDVEKDIARLEERMEGEEMRDKDRDKWMIRIIENTEKISSIRRRLNRVDNDK